MNDSYCLAITTQSSKAINHQPMRVVDEIRNYPMDISDTEKDEIEKLGIDDEASQKPIDAEKQVDTSNGKGKKVTLVLKLILLLLHLFPID